MHIIYIIEDSPKIFNLLKDVMSAMKKEKYLFVNGEINLSSDIEKDFSERFVLIFQYICFVDDEICIKNISESAELTFIGDVDQRVDLGELKCANTLILNAEALEKVKNIENIRQVITCGLKEKDTVTFSSIEEDGIVLNLQRTIKNIKNKNIDPFEEKIYITETELRKSATMMHEDLITALSILLFCDMI